MLFSIFLFVHFLKEKLYFFRLMIYLGALRRSLYSIYCCVLAQKCDFFSKKIIQKPFKMASLSNRFWQANYLVVCVLFHDQIIREISQSGTFAISRKIEFFRIKPFFLGIVDMRITVMSIKCLDTYLKKDFWKEKQT